MKNYPNVGDKCYLRQFTGSYYIDAVKRPYTVISVDKTRVLVQACKLHFPIFHYDPKTMSEYYKQFDGQETAFYDTIAESIEADSEGSVEELTWHSKKGLWGTKGRDTNYPEYAIFEQGWVHASYLD